jgi:hypothetical protein
MKTLDLHDDAEHEAFDESIEDLRKVLASQRELMQSMIETIESQNQTIDALISVIPLLPVLVPSKRRRGRPKKVIDDRWLVEEVTTMKSEFIASNKFTKPTDTAVLNWYFEQVFAKYGIRAAKVYSEEFQGKLKSLKNRLGDARHPIRKIPIK